MAIVDPHLRAASAHTTLGPHLSTSYPIYKAGVQTNSKRSRRLLRSPENKKFVAGDGQCQVQHLGLISSRLLGVI